MYGVIPRMCFNWTSCFLCKINRIIYGVRPRINTKPLFEDAKISLVFQINTYIIGQFMYDFIYHSNTPDILHGGWVTHICVCNLTIIGSDNDMSPDRRQATIWINAGTLLFKALGTNFSEILIEIHIFSFNKMHLKMSSVERRPFRLGLNVLNTVCLYFINSLSSMRSLTPFALGAILKCNTFYGIAKLLLGV